VTRKADRPAGATRVELRRQAEETLLEKIALAPENLDALSPLETLAMLHELRVHQIELEMQNEELRRAQLQLDTERARYFDLWDLAPVGYLTISGTGLILKAKPDRRQPTGSAAHVVGQAALFPVSSQGRPGRLLPAPQTDPSVR